MPHCIHSIVLTPSHLTSCFFRVRQAQKRYPTNNTKTRFVDVAFVVVAAAADVVVIVNVIIASRSERQRSYSKFRKICYPNECRN